MTLRRRCNVECVGQRPSLGQWMKLHYIAAKSHAWGGAGETREDSTADFAMAQLTQRVGDRTGHDRFLTRAGYWRNLFNPEATAQGGYIQNRNADGGWPAFKPGTHDGFVEGSAAQYLWMVPFDVHGLFTKLGGLAKATQRMDAFFHDKDGHWALTDAGPLHAELNNEPSINTPWLYDYAGQPWKTQKAVRIVPDTLWKTRWTASRERSLGCLPPSPATAVRSNPRSATILTNNGAISRPAHHHYSRRRLPQKPERPSHPIERGFQAVRRYRQPSRSPRFRPSFVKR